MGVAVIPQDYPYLDCKREGCGRPMPLPQSSRLGKYPSPHVLPMPGIREIFVNPLCGHVCDYTESDVRWSLVPHVAPDRPERPFSALVEWNCDVENCKTRVIVQRPTRGRITPGELMNEAREKWEFCSAHCPKGHLLTQVPADAWAYEMWASDLSL